MVEHHWVADTVVPTASIAATPLDNDKSGEARFVYNTNDDNSGFKTYCQLDEEEPELCGQTEHVYSTVADGEHTFTLTALDAAGALRQAPSSDAPASVQST